MSSTLRLNSLGIIRACADDIGSALRHLSLLRRLLIPFARAQRFANLRINVKNCALILVVGAPGHRVATDSAPPGVCDPRMARCTRPSLGSGQDLVCGGLPWGGTWPFGWQVPMGQALA